MFIKRWLGVAFILFGMALFFVNPIFNLTGYSIAENLSFKEIWFYVWGLGFLFLGTILASERIPVPAGLEDIVTAVGPFENTPEVFVDTSTIIKIRKSIKEAGGNPSTTDFLGADVSGNYQYFIPQHGLREMQGLSRPTNSRGYSPHGGQTIELEAFRYLSSYFPREEMRKGGVKVKVQKNPNLHFVDDTQLEPYEGKVRAAIEAYRKSPKIKRCIDNAERERFLRGADAKLIAGAIRAMERGIPAVVLTEDSLVREVVNYLNRTKRPNESEIKAYGVGDWQKSRGYSSAR